MKKQVHKSDDGKAKARPRIKASSQVLHPTLQLQQLVGNKAVTSMIQREKSRRPRLEASNATTSIVQRENEGKDYSQDIDALFALGKVFQSRGLKNRGRGLKNRAMINANRDAIVNHSQGGGHRI